MQFLQNSWRTWSGIASLIVVATKGMGASTWSWSLTLFVSGLLGLSSLLATLIVRLLRPKPTGPANGGDVVLMPGKGARGGADGRIVLVGHMNPMSPMLSLSWKNVLDKTAHDVDVYVTPGWIPLTAKEGSFLFRLDLGILYRREGNAWVPSFRREGS